jgi:hypothetical protein
MTNFIRIQQKLAINNVFDWKDKEIAAAKSLVNA